MSNIFDLFKKIEKHESASAPLEYIIVGLGNPGPRYERTRHNAGFRTIAEFYGRYGITGERSKFDSLCADGNIAGHRVLFLRPQTLMNASGRAVRAAVDFYKLPCDKIIVISDDINLDVGRMRVRRSGSSGGQKGLGDIIEKLGTDAFARVRVGVGKKPTPEYDLADWVLSRFTDDEEKALANIWKRAADAVECIISEGVDAAMCKYNG